MARGEFLVVTIFIFVLPSFCGCYSTRVNWGAGWASIEDFILHRLKKLPAPWDSESLSNVAYYKVF
jgi:hypothetical protein